MRGRSVWIGAGSAKATGRRRCRERARESARLASLSLCELDVSNFAVSCVGEGELPPRKLGSAADSVAPPSPAPAAAPDEDERSNGLGEASKRAVGLEEGPEESGKAADC